MALRLPRTGRMAPALPLQSAHPCTHADRRQRHRTVCRSAYYEEDVFEDIQTGMRKGVDKHRISWYPGHIAKAERQLKEQLCKVDIVFEVRDARILNSTIHPSIAEWIADKNRFILVNRTDMVSPQDLKTWQEYYRASGEQVFFTNGESGAGIHKVTKAAQDKSAQINAARLRRGLKPRPVRACVVGFPNIGKSAIINRLSNRKVCESAKKAGVTRNLKWVRMGKDLDLLDSPGIIPGSMQDQIAAERLAICNDIGQAAYDESAVAAGFVYHLKNLPDGASIIKRLEKRYEISYGAGSAEDFVWQLGAKLFQGDPERAGARILKDYRDMRCGPFALEHPPAVPAAAVV